MASGARPTSMTFASSESLYGRLGVKAGLRIWLSKVIIQVWPSGGALAAMAAPIAPAAPGLLSITVAQPVLSLTLAARRRATGSVVPPGGKGTTTRIGPLGHSVPLFELCARTRAGAARAAVVPARRVRRRMLNPP